MRSSKEEPENVTENQGVVVKGITFMTLSYVSFNVFFFLSRIVMTNYLSVADYGLVTYCWATGSTIGFLMMVGREQDILVVIPRLSHSNLAREVSYVIRTFAYVLVIALIGVLGSALLTDIDVKLWAISGFAIGNMVFQMESYTFIGTKSFKSHFMLNALFYGGAFASLWLIGATSSLDSKSTMIVLLLVLLFASFVGKRLSEVFLDRM